MKTWFYDIEIYRNFFSVIFINKDTDSRLIELYIKADIDNDLKLKRELLKEIKPVIFMIYEEHNDLDLLQQFLIDHKVLVGYNSINYDDLILDFLSINYRKYNYNLINKKTGVHINKELYNLSQDIISWKKGYRYQNPIYKYYRSPYDSIDLQKLLYLDASMVSLKQVAIQLKWYRIQDLPIPYYEAIKKEDIPNIIDYNINDVLITRALYYAKETEIKLRPLLSRLYGVNLLSDSRSGIANKLLTKFYGELSKLKRNEFIYLRTERRVIKLRDIIYNNIEFHTEELKALLSKVKNTTIRIGVDKFDNTFIFNYKQYKFALGGLHSEDRPAIYNEDDDYIIEDADADSYYPSGIINHNVAPKHLNQSLFVQLAETLTTERLNAKKLLKKIVKLLKSNKQLDDETKAELIQLEEDTSTKTEGLKIVINAGLFGKMGSMDSFLYDLKAMYEVTVNNQLYLMMLIEMLYLEGIDNISANTDGVISKIPRDKYDVFLATCKKWEDITKFKLSYTRYSKYVCFAVNSYISIKPNNEVFVNTKEDDGSMNKHLYIKQKGLFVDDVEVNKGYKNPIVAKALFYYYVSNIPIKDTIYNSTDIYDFCISVKTGEDFIKEYHHVVNGKVVIDILQKNVRYYISKTGGSILKKYSTPKVDKKGTRREYISLHKGTYSTIFNDYIHYDDFNDYNINYNYYIKECYKIINAINNMITLKMKKNTYGGLFD